MARHLQLQNFGAKCPQGGGRCKSCCEADRNFYAERVNFRGSRRIEVPHNHKMTAVNCGDDVTFELGELDESSWHWSHRFEKEGVRLTRQEKSAPHRPLKGAAREPMNQHARSVDLQQVREKTKLR